VLSLTINTRGGDIEQAKLLTAYPDDSGFYRRLSSCWKPLRHFVYQAQSGLTGKNGPDNPANGERPLFQASAGFSFTLAGRPGRAAHPADLYRLRDGAIYTKTFVLKRGSYAVNC
jgi:YidC/Oxa1 family membrane protein insertase